MLFAKMRFGIVGRFLEQAALLYGKGPNVNFGLSDSAEIIH